MTNTTVIKQTDPHAAAIARQTLNEGGVIAIATDTVYGVGCMLDNTAAIARIYAIKGRNKLKAIPVLIGDETQLELVADNISGRTRQLTARFWPGALTVIISKHQALPDILTTYGTVGVRLPNHDWLRELIKTCGPLAVTSANISGEPSLATAEDVLASLDGRINLLVDGGRCDGGVPSTVVDCSVEPPVILREGAIADAVVKFMHSLSFREGSSALPGHHRKIQRTH